MIPKSMKIGRHRYTIYQRAAHKRKHGTMHPQLKTMTVYATGNDAEDRDTLWHETTHAILFEMRHPLARDEAFVTKFANLLSKAIDSARF